MKHMSRLSFFCDSLNLRLFNQEGKQNIQHLVRLCWRVWISFNIPAGLVGGLLPAKFYLLSRDTCRVWHRFVYHFCVTLFWLSDIVAIVMNFNLFTAVIWKQLQDNSLCFLLCQLFSAFGLPRHEFLSPSFLLHGVSHRLGHSSRGRFLTCNQDQEKGLAWHAND